MLEDSLNDIGVTTRDCDSGCKTTEYKEIDVTVPITIEPSACLGNACVEIIDDPCIIPVPRCMRKHNCRYAIKQRLCVIFPIEFNAVATSGTPMCSLEDNYDNCNCEEFECKEIKDKIKDILKDKIQDKIEEKIKDKIKDKIQDKIEDKIKDKIEDKIKDKIQDKILAGILKEERKAEDKDSSNFIQIEVGRPQKGKKANIKDEQGVININNNTNLRKVIEAKKCEDELETLFSYKKLGNYLEIII